MGPQLGPIPKPAVKGQSRRDSLEDSCFSESTDVMFARACWSSGALSHGIGSQSDGLLIEGT